MWWIRVAALRRIPIPLLLQTHGPAKRAGPTTGFSGAAKTYFWGESPLGFGPAVSVYDALAQTPFVSLYSTASEHEDLAELVAWHEVASSIMGNWSSK